MSYQDEADRYGHKRFGLRSQRIPFKSLDHDESNFIDPSLLTKSFHPAEIEDEAWEVGNLPRAESHAASTPNVKTKLAEVISPEQNTGLNRLGAPSALTMETFSSAASLPRYPQLVATPPGVYAEPYYMRYDSRDFADEEFNPEDIYSGDLSQFQTSYPKAKRRRHDNRDFADEEFNPGDIYSGDLSQFQTSYPRVKRRRHDNRDFADEAFNPRDIYSGDLSQSQTSFPQVKNPSESYGSSSFLPAHLHHEAASKPDHAMGKLSLSIEEKDDDDEKKSREHDSDVRWSSFLHHQSRLAGSRNSDFARDFKTKVIQNLLKYIDKTLRQNPAVARMDRLQLQEFFVGEFNPRSFMSVWFFMRDYLDVEKSSPLGIFIMKSRFVNMAVEGKFTADRLALAGGAKDKIALAKTDLLALYDALPDHPSSANNSRAEYHELFPAPRPRTNKRRRYQVDILQRIFVDIGQPPPPSAGASSLPIGGFGEPAAAAAAAAASASRPRTRIPRPQFGGFIESEDDDDE